MSTSREVNKIPLPLIKPVDGLRIPRNHKSLQTDYAFKTDTVLHILLEIFWFQWLGLFF